MRARRAVYLVCTQLEMPSLEVAQTTGVTCLQFRVQVCFSSTSPT